MAEFKTSLTTATVYPDRARLQRRGRLAVEAGFQRLEIVDLPRQVDPDSARVAARGTARARLLGLQVHKAFYSETPAEAVRQLEMQLEAAQDEMAALEASIQLVEQNRARLEALAGHTQIYATALAAGEQSLEAQLALFDGLRARAGALDAERVEQLASKRALERRIQQLKQQLDQLRGARPRERYSAFVELEVLEAGELEVELNYVVSGASWKPLYDLRLLESSQGASLEVGYLAQVTQGTGEDWQDVDLTLSTARPALAATLPELNPWYIRPLEPLAKAARRPAAAPMMMDAMAMRAPEAETTGAEPPEAEVEMVTAQVQSAASAVTYRLPVTVSIPADGAPHKVSVARFSLSPSLDYASAPKLVEAAYRRARVANQSPYTLLPGAANLFAGEEFIGATRLELVAPGGQIELYLGADDRVVVERELKRREVDKRIIGGKRRLRYGYEIRLENLLPTPASITLRDQLPVARHEEIKVRLEEAWPEPARHSELNVLEWELRLEAGEKAVVRFDFSVEHPAEMDVVGLP
ncbi:MAG: mucoidy inhibitor MuiA family protein [Anaerolineales bacterium]|nr:mucoidy inhibitor MuiA family protein [Anaerolineales bacterium]